MKITLAKTKNLALLLFFLLAINNANYSQCIGTSIYPAGTVTVSPTVQTIVDNNYPLGNYAVCNFGALGQYRVDASIGQFVTLTDNSNVVIASGPTPFVFNIPSAGLYRIHIFNDAFCSTFGTPPIIAINPTNKAFYFDGINDYINVGNSINSTFSGTNKLTVEAWVKPSTITGNAAILGNYSTTANSMQFLLRREASNFVFWTSNGSFTALSSVATVTLNTWTHVAGTWDGSVMRIYVNGVLSGTTAATGSFITETNPVWIGGDVAGSGEYFNGAIDEVRIWKRALCQGEIQNNINGIIPSTATNLVGNYHFDHGIPAGTNTTVTTLVDYSGSAYNGTVTNAALTGTISNWVSSTTFGGSLPVAPAFVNPTIAVTSGTINSGSSFTMVPSGGVTYTYTPSGPVVSPTTTSTYSVVGTNSLGCVSSVAISTVSVVVIAGAALNFNSATPYDNVVLPTALSTALSSSNKLTVEAWVKPTNLSGSAHTVVGNYSNPNNQAQFFLRCTPSFFEFYVGNSSLGTYLSVNSAATPSLNVWQHVACVWNGNVSSIFVNGILSGTVAVNYASLGVSTNSLIIGGNGINENFDGSIDEVRIWNRALCQSEIQNNINGEIATTANGLLANYHFNQGVASSPNPTVTTLSDASGNNYNGVVTNFSLTGTTSNWVSPGAVTSGSNVAAFVSPSVAITGVSTICSGATTTLTASGVSTYSWTSGPMTSANSVSPTTNTTYSVVGTNSLGCVSNMAMQTVTVNAKPIISAPSTNICAGATGTIVASGANTYTWNTGVTSAALSASPSVNTTYTVNGLSSAGCAALPVTATITVGAAPSIAVSNLSVCAGRTATLTASGVTTYTWSNGANTSSIVITPTANVTYTVSGNLTGCGVVATNTSAITLNALPTVAATSNNTLICVGQTASLTASGATSYTWNTSATTTVIAVSPTVTTTYTVNGVNANGCSNVATVTQSVSACTGIDKLSLNIENLTLKIYPNPTNGILNVDIESVTLISIYNTLGAVLYSNTLEVGTHQLNLSAFANGLYILKASNASGFSTKRLIKE